MQAVGFSSGDEAETAGASDEAAGAGDAEPAAEAAGAGAPGGVPTVQPQPFVPRFEVPDDLRDSLPETERMHKVRGLFRITVTSDAQHQGLTVASGRHGEQEQHDLCAAHRIQLPFSHMLTTAHHASCAPGE